MSCSKKALWWSADKDVTPAWLKDETYTFDWSIDDVADRTERYGIEAFDSTIQHYHFKFYRCSSYPPIVYYRGNPGVLDRSLLWIVWPRKPSAYITRVMEDLWQKLASYELCTVSWGATGVDMLAHTYSLDCWVPTVVVLGGGFRRYTLHYQRKFLQRVVDAGWLILSAWKLDQEPTTYTFPQRNKLIAWLADMIFVPWASKQSWSLITVDFAVHFNTPVYSVPASIYEQGSDGTNTYIAERKIVATTDLDVMLSTYFTPTQSQQSLFDRTALLLSEDEIATLGVLAEKQMDCTGLSHTLQKDVSDIMAILLHLELKQLVYCPVPGVYAKK